MGVGNLRVDVPDFRPQPGVAQEQAGDIPERVALDDHVAVRMIRIEGNISGKQ